MAPWLRLRLNLISKNKLRAVTLWANCVLITWRPCRKWNYDLGLAKAARAMRAYGTFHGRPIQTGQNLPPPRHCRVIVRRCAGHKHVRNNGRAHNAHNTHRLVTNATTILQWSGHGLRDPIHRKSFPLYVEGRRGLLVLLRSGRVPVNGAAKDYRVTLNLSN